MNTYKKNINKNNKEIIIYQIIRDSINLMVKDVIKKTISNIRRKKIKNISSVYNSKDQIVEFSSKFKLIEREIKLFLKKNMYNNQNVLNRNNRGKKIIKNLFKIITKKPKKFINSSDLDKNKFRAIADYISGMTDRFAINLYKSKI